MTVIHKILGIEGKIFTFQSIFIFCPGGPKTKVRPMFLERNIALETLCKTAPYKSINE
jgi:hypothetical protein